MLKVEDEIVKFIKGKVNYKDIPNVEEVIRDYVVKHLAYGTLDVLIIDGKIKAVVRYNITPSGKTAEILDLFVDKEVGLKAIRYFILNNWRRWPDLKYIKFFRLFKYPGRVARVYRIDRLVKEK